MVKFKIIWNFKSFLPQKAHKLSLLKHSKIIFSTENHTDIGFLHQVAMQIYLLIRIG